ncbi:MAG: hypothetical protein H6976_16535 [Gammaproteobacteria bacterium]|nr:hypothetical protein [Gammaproteobacteria bacterium]
MARVLAGFGQLTSNLGFKGVERADPLERLRRQGYVAAVEAEEDDVPFEERFAALQAAA